MSTIPYVVAAPAVFRSSHDGKVYAVIAVAVCDTEPPSYGGCKIERIVSTGHFAPTQPQSPMARRHALAQALTTWFQRYADTPCNVVILPTVNLDDENDEHIAVFELLPSDVYHEIPEPKPRLFYEQWERMLKTLPNMPIFRIRGEERRNLRQLFEWCEVVRLRLSSQVRTYAAEYGAPKKIEAD